MRLRELDVSFKVAYLFFCVLAVLGLVFALVIVELKVGRTPADFLTYYRGNEELMKYPKTPLQLAEVSHFHSFITSVLLLVSAFFFSFTSIRGWVKTTTVVFTAIGMLGLVLVPWVLRFGPEGLVLLKPVSSLLMVGGLLFMMGATLKEMFL